VAASAAFKSKINIRHSSINPLRPIGLTNDDLRMLIFDLAGAPRAIK